MDARVKMDRMMTAGEGRPEFSVVSPVRNEAENVDTLVREIASALSGRAFEITPAGQRVWEYVNPHRAGERQELIATLFELVRLPADVARFAVTAQPDSGAQGTK